MLYKYTTSFAFKNKYSFTLTNLREHYNTTSSLSIGLKSGSPPSHLRSLYDTCVPEKKEHHLLVVSIPHRYSNITSKNKDDVTFIAVRLGSI